MVDYSFGFLEGAESGKKIFLDNLAKGTVEGLKLYIDAMARGNPQALHHVYEWYQAGNRGQRLFDIEYRVTSLGISIDSKFRQSKSIQSGSYEPFYNKAKIMEEGIPVVIKPKNSNVLVFDGFMNTYFAQSFLTATGLYEYLNNPKIYKKNFAAGIKGGRSVGKATGFKWMVDAKVEVE